MSSLRVYEDGTYDQIASQHDVGGVLVNMGTYGYLGDTLVLTPDANYYIERKATPLTDTCQNGKVVIHFIEFSTNSVTSPDHLDHCSIKWQWDFRVNAKYTNGDTFTIWQAYNGQGGILYDKSNYHTIELNQSDFNGVSEIWFEHYNTKIGQAIKLPDSFTCLDVSIPVVTELGKGKYIVGAQYKNTPLAFYMNRFVFEQKKSGKYIVHMVDKGIKVKYYPQITKHKVQ